jgi:hypothetical protein
METSIWTLSSLPVEILGTISSSLDFSELWRLLGLSGCKSLSYKLGLPAITSSLIFERPKWQKIPSSIFSISSRLSRLQIVLPETSHPFLPSQLLLLPKTLLEIEFRFVSAEQIWFCPLQEVNADRFRSLCMTASHNPALLGCTPIRVSDLFPNLVLLHLSSTRMVYKPTRNLEAESFTNPTFWSPLGSLDPRLSASEHLTFTWTPRLSFYFIDSLPSTITSLESSNIIRGACRTAARIATILPLPSSLEHLIHESIDHDLIPSPILQQLKTGMITFPDTMFSQRSSSLLRSSDVAFTHLSRINDIGGPERGVLREIYLTPFDSKHQSIAALPLRSFIIAQVDHLDNIPPGWFPANLTELHIHNSVDWGQSFRKYLPANLLRLSIKLKENEGRFEDLPRSLTSLYIFSFRNFSAEQMKHLPPRLTQLSLLSGNRLMPFDWQCLPRSITSLHLFDLANVAAIGASILQHMPPNLSILLVDQMFRFSDHEVGLLPRTLTNVKLPIVRITGRTLDPNLTYLDADIWQTSIDANLPPKLKASNSFWRQVGIHPFSKYQPLEYCEDSLENLPYGLTELNLEKMNFSSHTVLSALRRIPLPSLQSLFVISLHEGGSDVISTEVEVGELSLPPSLTKLECLDMDRLFMTRCEPEPLPNLKELRCYHTHVKYHPTTAAPLHWPSSLTCLQLPHIPSWSQQHTASLAKLSTLVINNHVVLKKDITLPKSITNLTLKCGVYDHTMSKGFIFPPNLQHLELLSHSWGNGLLEILTFSKKQEIVLEVAKITSVPSQAILPYLKQSKMTHINKKIISQLCQQHLIPEGIKMEGITEWEITGWQVSDLASFPSIAQQICLVMNDEKFEEYRGVVPSRLLTPIFSSLSPHLVDLFIPGVRLPHYTVNLLPATLKSLLINAHFFSTTSYRDLPRQLTTLMLEEVQKFNEKRAKALPDSLLHLRLESVSIANKTILHLPRNLTTLELPESIDLGIACYDFMPPYLERLVLPHLWPSDPRFNFKFPTSLRSTYMKDNGSEYNQILLALLKDKYQHLILKKAD